MGDYNERGLPADARLAAKVLRDKEEFSTGQSILSECADRIEALTDERDAAYEAGIRAGLEVAAALIGVKVGHGGEAGNCQCGRCGARRDDHAEILALDPAEIASAVTRAKGGE